MERLVEIRIQIVRLVEIGSQTELLIESDLSFCLLVRKTHLSLIIYIFSPKTSKKSSKKTLIVFSQRANCGVCFTALNSGWQLCPESNPDSEVLFHQITKTMATIFFSHTEHIACTYHKRER